MRAFDRYDDFDGIALLAVLEHLRDPGRLLKTIAARMKPGATLIVEVPDADAFGRHPAIGRVSEPLGEFSNEHINFFGVATLHRLARDAGLSLVGSEPFHYTIGIDGLLAAFRKAGGPDDPVPAATSRTSVRRYVAGSLKALEDVEARLLRATAGERPVVLYGAGSHSARLLAQGCLADARIDVVLDRNPHLTGRTIGPWPVALPGMLERFEGRPVIVSTFNAMTPVVDYLRRHFPNDIVPLYARERSASHDPSRPDR
jgi:SAM-dependent methyltransferase